MRCPKSAARRGIPGDDRHGCAQLRWKFRFTVTPPSRIDQRRLLTGIRLALATVKPAPSARCVEGVEMDTGSRPEWAARVAAELYRRGAKGSLKELVALALKLWVTDGHQRPEAVAVQHEHLTRKDAQGRSDNKPSG